MYMLGTLVLSASRGEIAAGAEVLTQKHMGDIGNQFESIADVATQGSEVDSSYNARVQGWKAAIPKIIQYPILGLERVKWSPIEGMEVNIPYDSVKDRTFFKSPSSQGTHVDIGDGIFAIMFPRDGHSPQHYVGKSEFIKKITIKVSI